MSNRLRKALTICLTSIGLIVSSCSTVPLATSELDAAAKTFIPVTSQANVYLARSSDGAGFTLFGVVLDGEMKGEIAQNTFYLFEVEPGQHKLMLVSKENQGIIDFNAEADKNYFFKAHPKMGWWQTRVGVKQLSDEEGQELVRRYSRAMNIDWRNLFKSR